MRALYLALVTAIACPLGAWASEYIRNVQFVLQFAGYDIDAVDGQLGPNTEQAVQLFEADYDLLFQDDPNRRADFFERIEQVLENCIAFTATILEREGVDEVSDETLDFCAKFAVRRPSVPVSFPSNELLSLVAETYSACGIGQHLTRYDFEYVVLQALRQSRLMHRSETSYDVFMIVFKAFRLTTVELGTFRDKSIACRLGAALDANEQSVPTIRSYLLADFKVIGDLMGQVWRQDAFAALE